MKLPVAMIDRNNTNAEVLIKANNAMKKPPKPRKTKPSNIPDTSWVIK